MKREVLEYNIAYTLAEQAHAGQFRRDGVTPYFEHPKDVARRVWRKHKRHDLMTVAILHDVLEDTDYEEYHLRASGMSEPVIEAVIALTKLKRQTRIEYQDAVANNEMALLVKIEDIASNLNDDPTPLALIKYGHDLQVLGLHHPDYQP